MIKQSLPKNKKKPALKSIGIKVCVLASKTIICGNPSKLHGFAYQIAEA
jgi:hypothetical protein